LQWIYQNKTKYNIKVVNLSLNSSVAQSYHTSPMDAACEILWFNGIVVVVSAGNNGTATLYPPANDPFVITVGATDDKGTLALSDDDVAPFSAYGTTAEGFAKPDLVAPGKNIIAPLPENDQLTIGKNHPANRVDSKYFRMSGTSMSAPMVSGAVALLLQDEPNLNPDQVKYRLTATANKNWLGYNATTAGAGYLDIYAAVNATTTARANTGVQPNRLLAKMAILAAYATYHGVPTDWSTVDWNSVDWNSVDWNSVDWNSVDWNSVDWNSVDWNSVDWNSVDWNSVDWNSVDWNSVDWNSVDWNSVDWNSVDWNSDYWGP
jgi:serine protease AprX